MNVDRWIYASTMWLCYTYMHIRAVGKSLASAANLINVKAVIFDSLKTIGKVYDT